MRPEAIKRCVGAFTLIEILFAIIILALGLLGLGAVFPVVIREQKLAQERIVGTLAEDNIRATLRGYLRLNQKRIVSRNLPDSTLEVTYTGWATLQEEWNYLNELKEVQDENQRSGRNDPPDFRGKFKFSKVGLWEADWGMWPEGQAPNSYADYKTDGDLVLAEFEDYRVHPNSEFPPAEIEALKTALERQGQQNPQIIAKRRFLDCEIPLAARLNPTGDPADGSPTYVWDFVARRKLETIDPRALQVAVFVRRVDPKLRPIPRVPPSADNYTISVREQVLIRSLGSRDRLPLGEDNQGLPTLDGTGGGPGTLNYSGIHAVDASFDADPTDPFLRKRDWIRVNANPADPLGAMGVRLISQRGQRAVDNLGNVYTVVDYSGGFLRVDPPVPHAVVESFQVLQDPELRTTIRQLIFTPQVPVLAFVMEIEP